MSESDRLRDRLSSFGIRPRRRLGQSFLHERRAIEAIAGAVASDRPPSILEIGPGPGTLTEALATLGPPLVAVEKDRDLVRLLEERFSGRPNVRILEGDILSVRVSSLEMPPPPSVVGNIPYNISTPILLRLIEQRETIGPATLMLQKELAERLRAPVGSRMAGSLTVLLRLVAEIRRVIGLGPGAFVPPPKVSSEVITLRWRTTPAVSVPSVSDFERVVRCGFGQRRKTLKNALVAGLGPEAAAAAQRAAIDLSRRAETLTLEEWAGLAWVLYEHASHGFARDD